MPVTAQLPRRRDLIIDRADTFSVVLTITDASGTAVNITGWTFVAAVSPNLSPNPLSVAITNAGAGQITVTCATNAPALSTKWSVVSTHSGIVRTEYAGKLSIMGKVSDIP